MQKINYYLYLSHILYLLLTVLFFLGFHRAWKFTIYPAQAVYTLITITLGMIIVWHWKEVRFLLNLPIITRYGMVVLWVLCCSLWAKQSWIVLENLLRWLLGFIFVVGLCHIFLRQVFVRRWIWTWLLIGISISAVAYQITMASYTSIEGRFRFPFGNPTLAGTVLGFGLTIAVMQILQAIQQKRQNIFLIIFNIPIIFLLGITLWVCRAKSGILASFLAILIMTMLQFWNIQRVISRLILLGLMILFLLGMLTALGLYYDWTMILDQPQIQTMWRSLWPSLEIRLEIWKCTLDMLQSDILRMLVGYGPGNFILAFLDFASPELNACYYGAGTVDSPHNWTLEIISEYGLIGCGLWIFFVIKIFQANKINTRSVNPFSTLGKSAVPQQSATLQESATTPQNHTWAVMAGCLMLLLDFQFSVSYIWVHGQMLWNIAIAWLASQWAEDFQYSAEGAQIIANTNPQSSAEGAQISAEGAQIIAPTLRHTIFHHNLFHQIAKYGQIVIRLLLLFVCLIAFKLLVWEHGQFYYYYCSASKIQHPLQRAYAMLNVPLPSCENFYTLGWQNDLTAVLYDAHEYKPEILWNHFERLHRLENDAPKFAQFGLYRAMITTIMFEPNTSSQYFAEYAEINPFQPLLWVWWYDQCCIGRANADIMLTTAKIQYQKFPNDPNIQLGYALALRLKKDWKQSQKIMQSAFELSRKRNLYCSTIRGRETEMWAEYYIKHF